MFNLIGVSAKRCVRDFSFRLVCITIIIVGVTYPFLIKFAVIKHFNWHFLFDVFWGAFILLFIFIGFLRKEIRKAKDNAPH